MSILKRLWRIVGNYPVVSFDVFDTLLKRDVFKPVDVFAFVERNYDLATSTSSNFKKKRIIAEETARKRSEYEEVTLDEIYGELGFTEEEKQSLKQIELNIESLLLHSNPELSPLYKKCLEDGKKVYLVSDMYLPSEFIEMILSREGISGYEKLYLSCEYRRTKRSGDLFRILCDETGTKPESVIHIGDSKYADIIGPYKAGIRGTYIKRNPIHTLYSGIPNDLSELDRKTLFAFINTRLPGVGNRGYRLGYEVLGPIIYAFCMWIHEKTLEVSDENSKLWFAARDMYLFYEAYKKIFPDDITGKYVYISRKSLRPLYAESAGNLAKSGDVLARGLYSLRQIADYMGYADVEIAGSHDLNEIEYDARRLEEYKEVDELFCNQRIVSEEKQRAEAARQYCRQEGLFRSNIILADVGWHGTTQLLLDRISDHTDYRVFGLYLGCLDGTDEKVGANNYTTFLFDEHQDCDFMRGIILFERLILAPHGSTIGYKDDSNRIVPILSESEKTTRFIEDVQQGARAFIEDYKRSAVSDWIQLQPEFVGKAFEKMVTFPLREELNAIGDLEYDNFYSNKMAAPRSIRYYMLHIKDLKYDFKYAPWRIGFLYRLFKIRLPYAKLYGYARKKQGKIT